MKVSSGKVLRFRPAGSLPDRCRASAPSLAIMEVSTPLKSQLHSTTLFISQQRRPRRCTLEDPAHRSSLIENASDAGSASAAEIAHRRYTPTATGWGKTASLRAGYEAWCS